MAARLNYEDSYRFLQNDQWLDSGDIPLMPTRPPRYDDEVLGISFFRMLVDNARFENLTLQRTYFGRSKISNSSFANSDLAESVANWNDFEDVDFTSADLSRFYFRACIVRRGRFTNSLLEDADLRCCDFEDCDFTGASFIRTKLTRKAGSTLNLTDDQREVIDWHDDDGPEPDGG